MSQAEKIFQHLLSGKQITCIEAWYMFRCTTCTQRIYDIKDVLRKNPLYRGWMIKTNIINGKKGKYWASYELIKTELEVAA